jgi:hypothetical protein
MILAVLTGVLAVALGGCPSGSADDPADPCFGEECSGHGVCAQLDGVAFCLCDAGYHADGLACLVDDPVDPCDQVACSGHGACVAVGQQASCECESGYHPEGLSCVEDGQTGPCFEQDCAGHGLCLEQAGAAVCRCDPGYHAEGLACLADPVDPCDGVDCSGHGQCLALDGQPRCECDPGYHPAGLACVADPDPCQGVDCGPHGACVPDGAAPVCLCDEGYEPDGLTCVESLCTCRERTRPVRQVCTVRQRCQQASDCCPIVLPPGLVCNRDYPFRYECQAGLCVNAICHQAVDCNAYAAYLSANSPGQFVNRGCTPIVDECAGVELLRYCDIRQTCQQAADCCPQPMPAGFGCLADYPYLYNCQEGVCQQTYCAADPQCDALFAVYSNNDPGGYVNDGCQDVTDPCTGDLWYSLCELPQACQSPADCCPQPMPAGYACLADYPYLYACEQGRCRQLDCASSTQCNAYYQQAFSGSDGYANLGCVEQ